METRIRIAGLWEQIRKGATGLVKPGRSFALLCAALFTCATMARSLEVPSADVWDKGEPLTWALVGVGLVTAVAGVLNLRFGRRRTRDLKLAEGCRLLAAHVDDACPNIALKHLDVIAWLVGGLWFARHLVHAQDFVLGTRLQTPGVAWVRGKGVIGRCWDQGAPVSIDLEKNFYPRATDAATFEALSEVDRLGLSWKERNETRNYEAIWAAPLRNSTNVKARVVGVVCVGLRADDQPANADRAAELDAAMMLPKPGGDAVVRPEVSAILATCQQALRDAE